MVRLSKLARHLTVETAFTVLGLARNLKAAGKDVVELEIGDSPFPSTPKAKAMGILDSTAFGTPLRRHPMGWVQLYLRDPAGNLLEVDWPDASTLAPSTTADIVPLEDSAPQDGDAAIATLYHS